MPAKLDLLGQRFGRLVVLREASPIIYSGKPATRWVCLCDCGNETVPTTMSLRKGHTRSCGCLQREHDWVSAPPGLKGEDHPGWKGDGVSYIGAHARVHRTKGPARLFDCVDCKRQAEDWSYATGCSAERIGKPGKFCPHPEHYVPRCRSCHRKYDKSSIFYTKNPSIRAYPDPPKAPSGGATVIDQGRQPGGETSVGDIGM